jgi:4-hydroxybenzoate polyprenyltransferase
VQSWLTEISHKDYSSRKAGFKTEIPDYNRLMDAGANLRADIRETVPLCVDLDGTLVHTDLLFENLMATLRRQPWVLLLLPLFMIRGRAFLKTELARRGPLQVDTLPFRHSLLRYLDERRSCQPLVLVTAADRINATRVAEYLGLFDEVLASDGSVNLKGKAKAGLLEQRFGRQGFDYAGNGSADLPVWALARKAVLAGVPAGVRRSFPDTEVIAEFANPTWEMRQLWRALRVHQWVKNLLIFLPLLLSHEFHSQLGLEKLARTVTGFFAFCLVASALYIWNDLLDLEHDRLHVVKRDRPFASGALPISVGLVAAPILLVASVVLAVLLPLGFAVTLGVYVVMTTAYSFKIKGIVLVDVMTLALLYTLRILAGGQTAQVRVSPWLLALSVFGFLSLALVKRYTELRRLEGDGLNQPSGRGYQRRDLPVLVPMGLGSGYTAALVMALYMQSQDVVHLYRHPEWLWPVCPLIIYWISRIWILAHRSEVADDPVFFAARDPVSYLLIAIIALLMWLGL